MSLVANANDCDYLDDTLIIFVVGASGDLAKKKTYPSWFDLFRHDFLTPKTIICGYARSEKSDSDFKDKIRPYLEARENATKEQVDAFLELCLYRNGSYDNVDDVSKVFDELNQKVEGGGKVNRLFYFAIPPTVFVPIGKSLKEAVISKTDSSEGWNRLIVEKPFGHDSESFDTLNRCS